MIKRILIANRGEIALRLIRACREMGIETVAIYSEADRTAPHARAADQSRCVGPAPSRESYLNVEAILDAARSTGADAIHPGYGFLSENAAFARAVGDSGLKFIGPRPDAIAAMGDKTAARATVRAAGVPVAPALEDASADEVAVQAGAKQVGYPLLIKAAAGGGGKGMRIVRSDAELLDAYSAAQREAQSAFGDGRVFLERYIERPRHIEVQILADEHGNVVHLGERECSIQRRHQKIIEEAPSTAVSAELRERMTAAAVAAARSVNYANAGTVEFLLADDGQFYFLEMNTRLQVEHPVTEWVHGIDLVHAQIRIARGEKLWFSQDDVTRRGHSLECRVYAEDPAHNFMPSPGRIALLHEPQAPWVRIDSGLTDGYDVPLFYDPMLAKVSVWGETREVARLRMISALKEYVLMGITTNISYLIGLLSHPDFAAGKTHTHFIADHMTGWKPPESKLDYAVLAAAIHTVLAPAASSSTGEIVAAHPSPWQTLGGWRIGGAV